MTITDFFYSQLIRDGNQNSNTSIKVLSQRALQNHYLQMKLTWVNPFRPKASKTNKYTFLINYSHFYKETTDSHFFKDAVSGKMNYEKGKTV